uniref:SET domain-containing protein n=1 Tax=Macrostomum lignano TaxID=282301 RepID=A0A1I8II65_9PLAT
CSPNSDIQKWTVGRQQRVGFFALRDIPAGEEVTVDYGFVQYGRELQKCYCNSPNCTGVMGSRSQQLQDRVQARDSSARDRQVARLLRLDRLGSPDDARCLVRLLVQESLDWDTRMRLVRLVGNTDCSASLQALRRCHAVDVLSSYLRELVADDAASGASVPADDGSSNVQATGSAQTLVLALAQLPVAYTQHVAQAMPLLERLADCAAARTAAASAFAKPSPADLLKDDQAMEKVIGLLSKFLNYLLSHGDPQCALTDAELLSVAEDRRLLGLLEYIKNLDDVSIITDKMELVPAAVQPPAQPPPLQSPSEEERVKFVEQLHQLIVECVDGVYASGCVDEMVRPRRDQALLAPQLVQQLMSPGHIEQLMRHTGGRLALDTAVQTFVREFVVDFMLQPTPATVEAAATALK